MPYPESPFIANFNYNLITGLLSDQSEENDGKKISNSNENLGKTLNWLCSAPLSTSIRVNTLKSNNEDLMELIRDHFKKNSIGNSPTIYLHPLISNTIIIENEPVDGKTFNTYEKEIIVDAQCASAVLRGAHIYAPGVLGMVSGCQVNDNVSIYADIWKKCKRGFHKVYNESPKVFIGNGRVLLQRHQLFGEKAVTNGIAVEVKEILSGCYPIGEDIFPAGYGLLQNLPSILTILALSPAPGDTVIDMCASPGNKTTHIAELMKNEGILVAIDKTPRKVEQLKRRCDEFGAKVSIFQADSTKILDLSSNNMRNVREGPPFASETFDKVLLDAPCSVLGKRPQLINRMSENEIKSFVPLQRKLFETAVQLLKPGGTLVYSTCTITLAENEGLVAWALRKFSQIELIKPSLSLGGNGWSGTSLTTEEIDSVQRFGPDQTIDSVGFFFACFRKKI
ncbi:unnamed protein product [Phyllotreta striolata]|uniref:SAM-dependent MTase RsmB/NOP-type domain-containing protein n=1 Tax=Phyllotreta striolata TaxID=444603 RepID=A0A9N9TV75_PHYSR|nr:unnamed protein product [Phyllotreta striolata]